MKNVTNMDKVMLSPIGDSVGVKEASGFSKVLSFGIRCYSIICFLLAFGICFALKYKGDVINGDGLGYYAYLPSFVIFGDPTLSEVGRINEAHPEWQQNVLPGKIPGRYFIKYPIGVALMTLPFFLVADALTSATGGIRDGYSLFYQYSSAIAGFFYFAAGLELLRRVLLRLFPPTIVLCTLLSITFGGSLFVAVTSETSYSHPYSFFLFCGIVYVLQNAIPIFSLKRAVQLGVLCGLIALVRNINVIFGIYIVSFAVLSFPSFLKFRQFVVSNIGNILVVLLVAVCTVIPQFLMWKYTTGSYLLYAYGDEGFEFLSPHIMDSLFSIRKGLFFWAPVLFLSMFGVLKMLRRFRLYGIPIALFMVVNIYLLGSWSGWWMGSCFGNRAFIDSYVVFAIPLAFFYDSLETRFSRWIVGLIATGCIAFTLSATLGYYIGVVPADKASRYSFIRFLSMYNVTPAPLYALDSEIVFTPERCEWYLGRGFYAPRISGTWSKIPSASIRLKLKPTPDKDLHLQIKGSVLPTAEGNSLSVKVNGAIIETQNVAGGETKLDFGLNIPKSVPLKDGVLHIEFIVSKLVPFEAVYPDREEAHDKLVVGFGLDSIRISTVDEDL